MNRRKRNLLILTVFLTLLIGIPMWKVWRMVRQETLNKALIVAVKRRDTEAAVSALESGADPNARDDGKQAVSFGEMLQRFWARLHGGQKSTSAPDSHEPTYPTPLVLLFSIPAGDAALVRENTTLLKALLKYGADPNSGDKNWTTPLIWAVSKNDAESARLLLEHHADPNAVGGEPYASWHAITPLHLADPVSARLLLAHGAKIEIADSRGATPLLADCQQGNNEGSIPILLEHGANVNARDEDGYTPLLQAAQGLSVDTIKALLAKGADLRARTKDGETALMLGAGCGNEGIVRLLLQQGIDVNARDVNGSTALMYAGDSSISKLLLDNGANPDLPGYTGFSRMIDGTPLMKAVMDDDSAFVKQLLKYGADINARNKEGKTALKCALERGDAAIIRLLKQNGAVQ